MRPHASEMGRASQWLEEMCLSHGVPRDHVARLLLCLDEALANVLDHGGPQALATPIRLAFEAAPEAASRSACVTVSDGGKAFDPFAAPDQPLPESLDDASDRGRGLQMMRACATVLRYRREGGLNHLTFGTTWE